MSSKTPCLFVSDSPNGPTGLGMITREIATRAHQHLSDVCYVGIAGYGDTGENKHPFPVYPFSELKNWTIPQLPWIWKQFAGDRKGILCFVWNIAWLNWLAYPERLEPGELRDFLMSDRFKLWAYVPVDSVCLNGRLSNHEERILRRLDRVLAYTKFGADAIDRTLGQPLGTTEHIPHGTDDKIFFPRDRKTARETLLERIGLGKGGKIGDDVIIIGIFATNTARKDFPLALEVCGRLVQKGHKIAVLIHTNRMVGDWNITELCHGFGLQGRVFESTRPLADHREVAWLNAACDVVLCPGRGEGWGSPASQSLACGVPIVTGNYAGSMEFVPPQYAVDPIAYHYESVFSNKRPVHDPEAWVERVEHFLPFREANRVSLLDTRWMWPQVWLKWEEWLRRGIAAESDSTVIKTEPRHPISLEEKLGRIRALNYDHHRRMTEDHNRIKAEEALHPENTKTRDNLDDTAFRSMLADIPKGGKILELGSASGAQWHLLREWSDDLTGIDLFEPAVIESQRNGLNIHLGFVEKMPFPDESFSAVISRHVMEHVADIQLALSEIKRVLKPGGYVAAATPHYWHDIEPAHINKLHIEEWVVEYLKAGLKIVSANLYECFDQEAHIVARKPENDDSTGQ